MTMKKITTMLILVVLVCPIKAFAIEDTLCELRNGRFVDTFQYAIDIYAESIGPTAFELGDTTLNFDFNGTALTLSTPALSNQYAIYNSGNYNPMTVTPHPTVADRLQFKITVAVGAVSGDTLPSTEILLATILFDVDDVLYLTNSADLEAVVAGSSVSIFGGGSSLLDWFGEDMSSLSTSASGGDGSGGGGCFIASSLFP